jgi:ubiquitin-protein ligase
MGPEDSPYAGGTWVVSLEFPPEYPFKAPEIKFLTPIYHPNVKTASGEICADVINSNWGPTLNAKHCLVTLRSMMASPNADSPVEEGIAAELRDQPATFEAKAKAHTKSNAM